jgi:formylglycine-generating enzyme required for sulfatase activity
MKPLSAIVKALITLLVPILLLLPFGTLPTLRAVAQDDQPDRGQRVKPTVSVWPAKAKRWALIIGVDQYRDSQISPLKGAANDARTLADALVKFAGFPRDQVILLATDQPEERHPTRINILRRLSNLASVVPPDGLLLVSFAGHGMERQGRAFLIPSDAQFDACRNDPTGRADAPNPLTEAYVKGFNFDVRNREVTAFATIYATAVGYRAYEYSEKRQGYFTWAVVEALSGAAANEKGEVVLSSLLKYAQENVPKQVGIDLGVGKQQKPFAMIDGYKAEELVIAAVTPRKIEPPSGEYAYWKTIEDSADPQDFRDYLAKYPNGTFSDAARVKLRRLEGKATSTSTPTPPSVVAMAKVAGPPVPLARFDFTTAKVDARGKVTKIPGQPVSGFVEDLGKGAKLEMVEIPAGTFNMGSPSNELGRNENEMLRRGVKVSAFYIGKYEVTQAQWNAVMDSNPSHFKGDNLPVEDVYWRQAVEFCQRLTKKTGREYRLPTEAEWEYAARAGTRTPFAFGETATTGIINCNGEHPYGSAPKGENRARTVPVGSLGVANAFGLFDMHGNVLEWCQDYYGPYDPKQLDNPKGPSSSSGDNLSQRVVRGGVWLFMVKLCRSAYREGYSGTLGHDKVLGFRVAIDAQTQ